MSMTLNEAKQIALDKSNKHATVTLDLASMILEESGEPALRQLADIKACLQRKHYTVAQGIGN